MLEITEKSIDYATELEIQRGVCEPPSVTVATKIQSSSICAPHPRELLYLEVTDPKTASLECLSHGSYPEAPREEVFAALASTRAPGPQVTLSTRI